MIRDLVMIAMEGRIETGNLGQRGKLVEQRADRREIMRLMEWRQRGETLQARDDAMVDQYGPVVIRTAVHDTMADGKRTRRKFFP